MNQSINQNEASEPPYYSSATWVQSHTFSDSLFNDMLHVLRCRIKGAGNVYNMLSHSDGSLHVDLIRRLGMAEQGSMVLSFAVPWRSRHTGFGFSVGGNVSSYFDSWMGLGSSASHTSSSTSTSEQRFHKGPGGRKRDKEKRQLSGKGGASADTLTDDYSPMLKSDLSTLSHPVSEGVKHFVAVVSDIFYRTLSSDRDYKDDEDVEAAVSLTEEDLLDRLILVKEFVSYQISIGFSHVFGMIPK